MSHVCTCHDCSVAPFVDECKFEKEIVGLRMDAEASYNTFMHEEMQRKRAEDKVLMYARRYQEVVQLAVRTLEWLEDVTDEGPEHEGWHSTELKQLMADIEKLR